MTGVEPFIAGKCCLVLDDEFLIALDIQMILENAGASEVVCVGNADDALAALQSRKFDFAVLDVKLSGAARTSLTVAAALADVGTPFVFLTGVRGDDLHLRQFPDAPMVEKPYDVALLLNAVKSLLGG
ncbi:MAG TPA: response regulator [Pseudolabrys sp.]|nr:response regulator [Pseudolabrys sp.]